MSGDLGQEKHQTKEKEQVDNAGKEDEGANVKKGNMGRERELSRKDGLIQGERVRGGGAVVGIEKDVGGLRLVSKVDELAMEGGDGRMGSWSGARVPICNEV